MSRRPWGIKPTEIKRAVTALRQTGLGIKEIKFGKDGLFSVFPNDKPAEADAPAVIEDLKA
jgi:hypothetical protein